MLQNAGCCQVNDTIVASLLQPYTHTAKNQGETMEGTDIPGVTQGREREGGLTRGMSSSLSDSEIIGFFGCRETRNEDKEISDTICSTYSTHSVR